MKENLIHDISISNHPTDRSQLPASQRAAACRPDLGSLGFRVLGLWLGVVHTLRLLPRDRNHKAPYCKQHVNPEDAEIAGLLSRDDNTQATEEAFSWLARSKHVFRTMHRVRCAGVHSHPPVHNCVPPCLLCNLTGRAVIALRHACLPSYDCS